MYGVVLETESNISCVSATLEIVPLLLAINHWFGVVNLLLHLTIRPFQKKLVWIPKWPLWSFCHCSPPTTMSSGNIVAHIWYDTYCCQRFLNKCMAIAVYQTPQFFIRVLGFVFFIGFGFLFFILSDCCCYVWSLSLSVGHPSIVFRLNHEKKLSVIMKTYGVFS
jgi:hypothetical protein